MQWPFSLSMRLSLHGDTGGHSADSHRSLLRIERAHCRGRFENSGWKGGNWCWFKGWWWMCVGPGFGRMNFRWSRVEIAVYLVGCFYCTLYWYTHIYIFIHNIYIDSSFVFPLSLSLSLSVHICTSKMLSVLHVERRLELEAVWDWKFPIVAVIQGYSSIIRFFRLIVYIDLFGIWNRFSKICAPCWTKNSSECQFLVGHNGHAAIPPCLVPIGPWRWKHLRIQQGPSIWQGSLWRGGAEIWMCFQRQPMCLCQWRLLRQDIASLLPTKSNHCKHYHKHYHNDHHTSL